VGANVSGITLYDILANIFQHLKRIRYHIILLLLLWPVAVVAAAVDGRDGGDKPSNINRALKIRFFVHNIFSYLYIMHVYFACGR